MTAARPVLIAYDGSPHAAEAVRQAGALLAPASAVVLCVWTSLARAAPAALLGTSPALARGGVEHLDAAARERAQELADEGAAAARDAGLEAEGRAVEGNDPAWATICHCAEELDAAVIVAGSRGRSALAATVLGSTSEGILHHAHRPVLIAPPAA